MGSVSWCQEEALKQRHADSPTDPAECWHQNKQTEEISRGIESTNSCQPSLRNMTGSAAVRTTRSKWEGTDGHARFGWQTAQPWVRCGTDSAFIKNYVWHGRSRNHIMLPGKGLIKHEHPQSLETQVVIFLGNVGFWWSNWVWWSKPQSSPVIVFNLIIIDAYCYEFWMGTNQIKLNCADAPVTEDACEPSPDNVTTATAGYRYNDINEYAISRRPLVHSTLFTYLPSASLWSTFLF